MDVGHQSAALQGEALGEPAPFWVAGLVVASVLVGWYGLGLSEEARDSATYCLLGVVVTVGTIALAAWHRATVARRALALGGVLVTGSLLATRLSAALVVASVFTWLVWEAANRRLARPSPLSLVAIAISWAALSLAAFWRPPEFLLSGSPYHAGLAAAAVVLVTAALAHSPTAGTRGGAAWTFGATLVFAISSVRAGPLHYIPAMHHWGAIVGPAEMIRQGGWLLWDVPAQYGFLSTLAIAVVPLRSVWQSFYVLNALLNFGAALLVFGLLRGAAAGPARNAFALVVAETAVFLVPGAPWEASGPWFVPNVGAFRFFWCYALLALLVRMHHTVRDGGRPEPLLVLGSVVWIVAAFWSAESAAYTSLVWIPAFAAIVTARFHHAPRRAARWLALPVALLAGSVAVVEAVYRIRLGHGPDWRAFVDHVLAYTGFNTAPIMPGGTVLLLLLALWAIASTGGELIRRRAPVSALALAWGAWAMLYGTASYFVVRSHDSNATNLVPLACAALAAAVELLHEHGRRTVTAVVYAALVPLFATVPLLGLAEPSKLGRVALELSQGYVANVDALLPQDPYLHGIAVTAGLTTDDFIAYLDTGPHTNVLPPVPLASADGLRWVTMPRAWLPMPLTLLVALPEARATVYLERASARVGSGGWLIQPIAGPNARSFGWLLRWIHTTHRPVRSFENRRWRATRFEPIRG